jgi:hypothetical protein
MRKLKYLVLTTFNVKCSNFYKLELYEAYNTAMFKTILSLYTYKISVFSITEYEKVKNLPT